MRRVFRFLMEEMSGSGDGSLIRSFSRMAISLGARRIRPNRKDGGYPCCGSLLELYYDWMRAHANEIFRMDYHLFSGHVMERMKFGFNVSMNDAGDA